MGIIRTYQVEIMLSKILLFYRVIKLKVRKTICVASLTSTPDLLLMTTKVILDLSSATKVLAQLRIH